MVQGEVSPTRIGILNLELGNLRSVSNAFYHLGFDAEVVSDAAEFDDLTHIVVPGVGAFAPASQRLLGSGLRGSLREFAESGRPLLGLCLGMQLLATEGEEGGTRPGLDLISGTVRPLDASVVTSIPHVGWNDVTICGAHPVFSGIRTGVDFYFVHSYRVANLSRSDVLATTDCGETFPAIVGRGNVLGFQFHPEKSQANGLRLLENFAEWDGRC